MYTDQERERAVKILLKISIAMFVITAMFNMYRSQQSNYEGVLKTANATIKSCEFQENGMYNVKFELESGNIVESTYKVNKTPKIGETIKIYYNDKFATPEYLLYRTNTPRFIADMLFILSLAILGETLISYAALWIGRNKSYNDKS